MPDEEMSVDEAVAQAAESTETQDVQTEAPQEEKQSVRGDVEYNWREARRHRELLEQRNQELESKLNQLLTPKGPEEELRIDDDDIITVKQARSLIQKTARQIAEETLRRREIQTMDDRLISKFPDFAQVVSKENMDILERQEPELVIGLKAMQSMPYEQAVAAYKMLKKHGFGDNTETAINKKKAIENSKKPVSVQTVTKSSSAIGNVHAFENGLTKEYMAQLRKEMDESRKRA